jgi:hypothetical protein
MARAPRSRPACGGSELPRIWPRAVPARRPVGPAAGLSGGSPPAVARRSARPTAASATVGAWGPEERAAGGAPAGAALVDQVSGYAMIVAAVVMLLATLYWTARPSGL